MNEPADIETNASQVRVVTGTATLNGTFSIPAAAEGIVLIAHASGNTGRSPRTRFIARALQESGLATLLLDLLTTDEETIDAMTAKFRFDMELLAGRIAGATDWLANYQAARNLGIGYFGASTGAGAALRAAAARPDLTRAVVSQGGRPDLAKGALSRVKSPTLLIVGEEDTRVLKMNREALADMPGETKLEIIPETGHLFEEPGAMDEVARLAGAWFQRYL